jgi:acetyl-CoA acetyltransferase
MSNKSKEVVIVVQIRTPIGTYKGSLKNIKLINLDQ